MKAPFHGLAHPAQPAVESVMHTDSQAHSHQGKDASQPDHFGAFVKVHCLFDPVETTRQSAPVIGRINLADNPQAIAAERAEEPGLLS